MRIHADALPDDQALLQKMLIEFQAFYDRETSILLDQIRLLRAQLYGRKSEKLPRPDGPQPQFLPFFDMPEPEHVEPAEEETQIPAHTRKKGGRKPLPDNLPRVECVHDLDDKTCPCGRELTRIGEEVSEQLDIIPAQARVIRHIRPKYACRSCEGLEDNGPTVKIAPVPPQIIPKSIVTPGLLAHILTGKFVDHAPFYRQEGQFKRIGVDISRTSMCSWAMRAAEACQPLLNLLQEEVLDGFLVQADETTVQVLDEPGRSPTSKSYMWLFRRGDPDRPIVVYQYHPTRAGKVAAEFLRGFKGYVQTDGYSGYDFLDQRPGIRHLGCWAHARRKFKDAARAQGRNHKDGNADAALRYIIRLYQLEREAARNKATPEEKYRMRQEQAKPILEEFRLWLSKISGQVVPKSLLGKAVAYTLRQWPRLMVYIENGRLSMDNNMAENAVRPFVLGRKNWLFSGTPEGAEASALLYSLIETAKANRLEPYAYLRHIFEHLPSAASLEDYEALLPWNLTPEKIAVPRQLMG